MLGRFFLVLTSVLLLGLAGSASAADPPKEDTLPPPKQVNPVPGQGQLRVDRYAVWQYYGVDRFGRFRPVVVNSPYGAYYLINGQCYPWTTTHPLEFMRVLVD
jgi:hypothetical protein